MFVVERFVLSQDIKKYLRELVPEFGFGLLGTAAYFRTYSRDRDGFQEQWADTVIRVVEGALSIRKDWYVANMIAWDEAHWQAVGARMADAMFHMRFLAAGRGLWAMGTDYIYERGGLSLNNCQYIEIKKLSEDVSTVMDSLMCVTDDTWVSTSFGPRQVSELIDRPFVAYVGGKPYYAPMGFFQAGVKPILTIEAQGFTLKLTDNHPLLTPNGWVEAGQLQLGDELVLADPGLSSWDGQGTEDEGYILGHLIGDGHLSHRGAATFESYEPEEEAADMRAELQRAVLALPGRADRDGWTWVPSKKCWKMRDQQAGLLAARFGMVRGNKVVTPDIERGSSAFYVGFLRGVFDTDGYVLSDSSNRRIILKWSDHESLVAVQRMLARLGIKAPMSFATAGRETVIQGTTMTTRDQWQLTLTGEDRELYTELIGFKNTKKQARATDQMRNAYKSRRTVKVTSIARERIEQPVYDVQVNDLHWFDANGIAAHNCGVGVGFGARHPQTERLQPPSAQRFTYVIPDSREGWVESLRLLIESYEQGSPQPVFDYSIIRPKGTPIKGFGGVASGPDPLKELHERTRAYLDAYIQGVPDDVRLVADMVNAVGACVVAGNVRRSAELYLGSPHDPSFLDLKNYEKYPERAAIGWMSNNSIRCEDVQDFTVLPEVAERVRTNGEPGIVNFMNIRKYGRYGEPNPDTAIGTNPCSEATLEDYELCNLVEVFPSRCKTDKAFYEAVELATIYASCVTLLLTHQAKTNAVVARNHRIGVSLSGIADWFDAQGGSRIITLERRGYRIVEHTNRMLAYEAGIPESIRKTVVKPSGTVSQLAGVSPGMHYPPYTRYIRRMRVGDNAPIVPLLINAGLPYEPDKYSANTLVFEFPVEAAARRGQRDISMWQKGAMVIQLQRHWADQMVSNTVTFDPKTEGSQIEDFLAFTVPLTKSISLLPDTDEGAYEQMPYEPITKAEYERRRRELRPIAWGDLHASDGDQQIDLFCEACERME